MNLKIKYNKHCQFLSILLLHSLYIDINLIDFILSYHIDKKADI